MRDTTGGVNAGVSGYPGDGPKNRGRGDAEQAALGVRQDPGNGGVQSDDASVGDDAAEDNAAGQEAGSKYSDWGSFYDGLLCYRREHGGPVPDPSRSHFLLTRQGVSMLGLVVSENM